MLLSSLVDLQKHCPMHRCLCFGLSDDRQFDQWLGIDLTGALLLTLVQSVAAVIYPYFAETVTWHLDSDLDTSRW